MPYTPSPSQTAQPQLLARPKRASIEPVAGMDSADLLRGQKAIHILHNGDTYRLQTTRLGKLILTK